MPSFTLQIIILTVALSLFCFSRKDWLVRLMLNPPAVFRGQVDRLLTHGFIHADGGHLFFNMFTLYFFGGPMEAFYRHFLGPLGFVGFYALAIIVASLPSLFQHRNDRNYYSLGASGGVSAVLFAYILLAPWQMLYLFAVIPVPAIIFAIGYVAYSIIASRKNTRINHSAHLAGAAFGVIATALLDPRILPHFFRALLHP